MHTREGRRHDDKESREINEIMIMKLMLLQYCKIKTVKLVFYSLIIVHILSQDLKLFDVLCNLFKISLTREYIQSMLQYRLGSEPLISLILLIENKN